MQQCTNELTPEMLVAFDQSPFTAEQLAKMDEGSQALIAERIAYNLTHPVTAAYLIATEGSLTRDGEPFSVNTTDSRSKPSAANG